MDGLSILNDALKLRWDAPYRFGASVAAICALVGVFTHKSALVTLAGLLGWLGWPAGTSGLRLAHMWLDQRSAVFVWLGVILMVSGTIFAYRGGRGAATALIGAALCTEPGSFAPFWILGGAIVIWLACRVIMWRVFDDIYSPLMRNYTFSFQELGAASVYAIAGPLKWAIFRFD